MDEAIVVVRPRNGQWEVVTQGVPGGLLFPNLIAAREAAFAWAAGRDHAEVRFQDESGGERVVWVSGMGKTLSP